MRMPFSLQAWTAGLAGLAARRPGWTLLAWAALFALAVPWAAAWPQRMSDGSDDLAGSPSAATARVLRERFDNPYLDPLVVVARGPAPGLARALAGCPAVVGVQPAGDGVWLVASRGDARAVAGVVRAAAHAAVPPGTEVATTGAAAIGVDMARAIAADSTRAERLVLPVALFLLLAAFGSPCAALLPVLLAMGAVLLALALAAAIAGFTPLGPYVGTIAPMLGLALGIDYGLLVVERFREARRAGQDPVAAARTAGGTAGRTVAVSAAVVAAALGALPTLASADAVAIGVGGTLVVLASALLTLGLLPALLVGAGRFLDWPRAGVAPRRGAQDRLVGWGRLVTRHRWTALALGTLLLLVLAWPARHFVPGMPEPRWLPQELESIHGLAMLGSREGLTTPLVLLVRSRDGAPATGKAGLDFQWALSRRLHGDPRVAELHGPVDLVPHGTRLAYGLLWAHADPRLTRLFVSRDGDASLLFLRTRHGLSLREAEVLVAELRRMGDWRWEVGVSGAAATQLDYQDRLLERGPGVMAFVLLGSGALLMLAFRSVLVPVKALLLNALVTLAAVGVVVLQFQDGMMGSLPPMIPLLVFCLTFGLSMDYELFMLARVREAWLSGAGEEAVARGLGDAGHVIAWAAALMGLVFCAFAAGHTVFVKLLGCGLASAVVLDATLVRALLAPAALALAGRWNWWPAAEAASSAAGGPGQGAANSGGSRAGSP